MSIRDQRQAEFANTWLQTEWGILNLCPRFGKIYTTINVLEKLKPKKVLIAYPDVKIKASWESDLLTRGYTGSKITYTTHVSLKKYVEESYDLIVIDEIHLLSPAQTLVTKDLLNKNSKVLGLTGTLSRVTEKYLMTNLELPVVVHYPIEQAIAEGVIADYEITVVKTALDNTLMQKYKSVWLTEKRMFDRYTRIIHKLESENRDTMFIRLARMRIIQNSEAKRRKTIQLLKDHKDERILVFCGVTAIADRLGIASYHSKSSEKHIFEDFMTGVGNHMAVVKIGNTGVTYKPLNKVIINYFDSNSENLAQKINRCMSMEYDNPDKKAHIYIVCSTEDAEGKWLRKALEFFDKSKIKYL